jgi:hypothetical protein
MSSYEASVTVRSEKIRVRSPPFGALSRTIRSLCHCLHVTDGIQIFVSPSPTTMPIHSSIDLKGHLIREAHFAEEVMSSNSLQQGRLAVHCAGVGYGWKLLRFSFVTLQTRLGEEEHCFSIRMYLFLDTYHADTRCKESNSLRVVSTVRVGRQRNRSSIPLQDNIFLCSFLAASGAHPASYAVDFEGAERPVCRNWSLTIHPPSGAILALHCTCSRRGAYLSIGTAVHFNGD